MATSTYEIRTLDEATWPAFASLVERNNGIFGGCWCMGFHPEGVGKDTTAELNQDRKLERTRAGRRTPPWCSRRRLPGLVPIRFARRTAPDQEPRGA